MTDCILEVINSSTQAYIRALTGRQSPSISWRLGHGSTTQERLLIELSARATRAVSAIFWTTGAAAICALLSRETEHVQVFIRRLALGLDQGNQQHLISTTFGGPSQARDLAGGP